MSAKIELGIVEIVKIVDRIGSSERKILDLLNVDKVNVLLLRGDSSELNSVERLFD